VGVCSGTVVEGEEVEEAIAAIKLVRNFRASKSGSINCSVGKVKYHQFQKFLFNCDNLVTGT